MKRPFLKTLSGKFVSRTVILTLVFAVVVGGLAIFSLRSLSHSAKSSVAAARNTLSPEAIAPLEQLADDISGTSSMLTLLLLLISVAGAVAAGALALVFARQITNPIMQLRNAAMKSTGALPAFVEASANGAQDLPELPSIAVSSGDEIEDLVHSFNQVRQTAVQLGVTQARIRQQNAERFVNLGRRSQNLLSRQMKFIDGMERDETNPENLQRLFQIDHLATRMRRNAESILVLAGQGSSRRLRRAVPIYQVIQAASSEIEHFDRIALGSMSGASVDGSAASDLAHLFAELLENATSFAAPDVATSVTGQPTEHGYFVEIVDRGIGMEAAQMAAANALFADMTGALDDEQSPSYLGHDVVARLARRHGVAVELAPTPGNGLTARVHIPHAVLAPDASAPAAAGLGTLTTSAVPDSPAGLDAAVSTPAPVEQAVDAAPMPLAESAAAEIPGAHDGLAGDAFTAATDVPVAEGANAFSATAAPSGLDDNSLAGFTAVAPDSPAGIEDAPPALVEDCQPVAAEAAVEQPLPEVWGENTDQGLTADQRAAIEWAIQKGGSVSAASAAGPADDLAAADLQPGPIDASVLAELDTTPSGFRRRVRGEEGADVFTPPSNVTPPAPAAPRSPDQLMAFRRGIETGRAEMTNPTTNPGGEL